ncbi:cytochrome c-type biogenesis protein CcmH [Krasilnikovia sp. M28-CT-15]|uniref:cytochrome c-type biogenesis protein CcmH n=1 Tax=Krasilnikovia sp. M28-CT-15 TaxID=3373540 RepID=UPI003875EC00
MRLRRLVTCVLVALALAGAGTAVWRSATPRPETATSIAAQLLCPACQGESVAQSPSPMAAAMRNAIAAQLAQGRSPEQIRQYFVDRYGPQILADPSQGGLGALLWLLPVLVLAALSALLWRARHGSAGFEVRPVAAPAPAWSPRLWDMAAIGVVAMVAAVALAGPRHADPAPVSPPPTAGTTLDGLGRSLEAQGRYGEAAEVYRDAVRQQPDDVTQLRLAFALLRANRAGEAATAAQQVLDHRPDDTQALLLLGLAQRAAGSPGASATLRRFLAAAPHDPAASQVRRLLAAS